MIAKLCSVLTVASLLLAPLHSEPAKGKEKEKGRAHQATAAHSSTTIDVQIVLGDYQRVVREYLDHQPGGSLPPGLAKRGGDLPPGLAKQLHKNGKLPPGLQKRVSPYPVDLSRRLPDLGDDYEGGFLHGRVVIFNKHTSAILDVFIP